MIKTMNVSELKQKIENDDDFILVDCREKDEWDQGHIEQARLIPLSAFEAQSEDLPKDKTIVLQCRSGKRSMNACQLLLTKGHTDLYNLEGGILDWIESGFEVTN